MRANFDKFRQNSTKSSEKQRNFEGHESGTNFPRIFEDGIVLTRSKFRPCHRYSGHKEPTHCSKRVGDVVPGVVVWPCSGRGTSFTSLINCKLRKKQYG